MSIKRRITRIVQANREAAKFARKDPQVTAYTARQSEWQLLEKARRSAADVAAHHHRVQLATREAAAYVQSLEAGASAAVDRGDDNAARAAIRATLGAKRRLEVLDEQLQEADVHARQLGADVRRLEQRVQDNALGYEAMVARRAAAQATGSVQDALASASRDTYSIEAARRADERELRQFEAQEQARDELSWLDPSSPRVQQTFEELETEAAAQQELDELKRRHKP